MITSEQVKDLEQLRKTVHDLISKGIADEYLLATYNGMVRHLDKRLPNIRKLAEGKALIEESRNLVRQQRQALGNKHGATTNRPPTPSQKSA